MIASPLGYFCNADLSRRLSHTSGNRRIESCAVSGCRAQDLFAALLQINQQQINLAGAVTRASKPH
jgi:hypothetical protein